MKRIKFAKLSVSQKRLVKAAAQATVNAYNVYSGFAVGAALLGPNGLIIPGVNIENSAYGSTLCAERVAIGSAYTHGMKEIKAIAIIAKIKDILVSPTPPCGSCLQVISELSQLIGHNIEIIMSSSDMKDIVISSIHELLPYPFGGKNLGEK